MGRRRELWFPVTIGLGVLAVLAGFRFLSGAGLGFIPHDTAGKSVGSGIVLGAHDNAQYNSWAVQAAEGRWLFEDRYTLEPHDAVFFSPTLLAVGRLSAALSVPIQVVMVVSAWLATFGVVVSVYLIARLLGLPVGAARWATVIAAFAGAYTVAYNDALFFPCAFSTPYISIANLYLCGAVLLMLALETARQRRRLRIALLLLLPAAIVLLGTTHPYEHVILAATYGGFFAVSYGGSDDETRRIRFLVFSVVAAAAAVVVAYHLWMGTLPVWREVKAASMHLPRTRTMWLRIYGAHLPLAAAGAIICRRDGSLERLRWMVVWLILLVVTLLLLAIPQTKISAGGHLPLSMLSGLAMYRLHAVSRAMSLARRILARLALVGMALALFAGSVLLLATSVGREQQLDGDLLQVARTIKYGNHAEPPRVLCASGVGRVLVNHAGARVYAANLYLTVAFERKHSTLIALGLEPESPTSYPDRVELARGILDNQRFNYVVCDEDSPFARIATDLERLQRVARVGRWQLYRVN